MNIIKKFTALTLIFCLLIPCIGTYADESAPAATDIDAFFDKMIALELLGETDTVNTEFMQRGDFLRLAMKVAGIKASQSSGEDAFSDLSETSVNRSYINTAAQLGYISGNSGKFNPQSAISYNEAVKIITEILGYGKIAAARGGFPVGYIACAQSSGLLDEISTENPGALILSEGLALIDAALDAKITETYYENNDSDIRFSNQTLAEYLDIGCVEGVVSESGGTGIYSRNMYSDDMICIADMYMKVRDIRDFDELLGMNCTAYYTDASKSGAKTLAYVTPTDGENNVITVNAADISYENGGYSYYEGDKEKNLKLSEDFSLIYNGQFAVAEEALMNTANGFVKLVDNNSDRRYDVVFVYEFTTHTAIDVNILTNSIITEKCEIIETETDDENYVSIYLDGNKSSLEDITAPAVVSYAKSLADDICIKTVYISSQYVSGVLDGVSDDKITVEGKSYDAADGITEMLTPGASYKFYIDSFGYATDYESIKKSYDYGYLWKCKSESGGLDPEVRVRIYNSAGVFMDYDLAEKITFNRAKKVNASDAIAILCESGSCEQFIRFRLDSDGKICFIETASDLPVFTPEGDQGLADDVFRLSSSGQVKYRLSNFTFDMKVTVGAATKVFFIPTTGFEEDFKLVTRATLTNDSTYTFDAYNANEYGVAEFVACTINYRGGTQNYYIADSVCKVLDSDGNERDGLKCSVNGTVTTFTSAEDFDLSSYKVKEGDVVCVGTNGAGNMAYLSMLWKYQENSYPDFMLNSSPYSQNIIGGTVVKYDRASGSLIVNSKGANYIFICNLVNVSEYDDGAWSTVPAGNITAGDHIVIRNDNATIKNITIIR